MFKVDDNVPLPYIRADGMTAALRGLKVGQSVLFPTSKARSVYSVIQRLGGGKAGLVTRTMPDGIRVWRVAKK